jgi:phage-related holin
MFVWCTILFLLGITAFMDSLFNYGEIFRRVNSVLFMLVSLGLLVRTTTKMKLRRTETYVEKIDELRKKLSDERVKSQRSAQNV